MNSEKHKVCLEKSSKFTLSAKNTTVNYKCQHQKTEKFVPKLWACCNDQNQIGALKHHQQKKMLDRYEKQSKPEKQTLKV